MKKKAELGQLGLGDFVKKKLRLLTIGDIQKTSDFIFDNRAKYSKMKIRQFKSGKIGVFGRR